MQGSKTPIFLYLLIIILSIIILSRRYWNRLYSITSSVHYTTSCNTQSSAPEDECVHRPKHVELIGNINKSLLLHFLVFISFIR